MPGISQECEFGAHATCALGIQCRCMCHAHTQQLIREGPKKPTGKGGLKRNVRKAVAEAAKQLPPGIMAQPAVAEEFSAPAELYNTCPKCHTRAKATDQFCRKDGTRLCLGKPCVRCEAPCEEEDAFCWQCGWNLAEAMPARETTIETQPQEPALALPPVNGHETESAPSSQPAEDAIVRLRRIAQERGLYPRETTIG